LPVTVTLVSTGPVVGLIVIVAVTDKVAAKELPVPSKTVRE
jgi:hypothetical protein